MGKYGIIMGLLWVVPQFVSVQFVYKFNFTMVFVGDISLVDGIITIKKTGGDRLVGKVWKK